MRLINLIGQKFERLTVIKKIDNDNQGRPRWLCQCSCGEIVVVRGYALRSGRTKSCGCLHRDIVKKLNTIHGHNQVNKISPTYQTWRGMITRCINSNSTDYHHYGDRDITICDRWLKFENFLKDMGERPSNLTLDRINNNLGYCKENCKWSTQKQQTRNTRRNNLITFNEETQCIAAWAEKFKLQPSTLRYRLKIGWPIEKALTTPARKKKND